MDMVRHRVPLDTLHAILVGLGLPFLRHLPPELRPRAIREDVSYRRNGRTFSSRTGRAGGLLQFELINIFMKYPE
jgi:hypothetical protein